MAHRRRPGPEFGGTEKFRIPKFLNDKISIFTPKISGDIFLIIDHIFQIFPVFAVRKNLYFRRNSMMTPFLLNSYFRTHSTTLLLKIVNTTSQNIGGTDAWAVPHLKFGGPFPQFLLSLRSWDGYWMAVACWLAVGWLLDGYWVAIGWLLDGCCIVSFVGSWYVCVSVRVGRVRPRTSLDKHRRHKVADL